MEHVLQPHSFEHASAFLGDTLMTERDRLQSSQSSATGWILGSIVAVLIVWALWRGFTTDGRMETASERAIDRGQEASEVTTGTMTSPGLIVLTADDDLEADFPAFEGKRVELNGKVGSVVGAHAFVLLTGQNDTLKETLVVSRSNEPVALAPGDPATVQGTVQRLSSTTINETVGYEITEGSDLTEYDNKVIVVVDQIALAH